MFSSVTWPSVVMKKRLISKVLMLLTGATVPAELVQLVTERANSNHRTCMNPLR